MVNKLVTEDRPKPLSELASSVDASVDFRRLMNQEVSDQMPRAVALFVSMMLTAAVIEWFYYPERLFVLVLWVGLLLATCAIGLSMVRSTSGEAAMVTLATVMTLIILLGGYLTFIHGSSELCLLAMIGYLTGVVVRFPWGPKFQAAATAGAIATYATTLALGIAPHLPIPYSMFALITHGIMTVIGASLLNQYRWRAFTQAIEAETHAAEAARANRSKSDFLASVSHELRTPLNIIFGYTDLLLEDAFNNEREKNDALNRIRTQSGNLLDMIQAMLDINKLEAGGITIESSEFRIGDFLEHLKTAIPASWTKEDVAIHWKVDVADTVMHSDAGKVEIILRNLIHNALKYTDDGEVRISAAAVPGNCKVGFTIGDTGQGIPREDLEHIFQMFQQSSQAPPRQGGVGLGLFLAKQLTTALGGSIHADSDLGIGSQFTVELPLETASTN